MKNAKHTGMTLIEIIVSVAIIAILAAGLFSVGSYIDTQTKIKKTESTIQLLVTALERYQDFYRGFPNKNSDLYEKLSLAPEAKKIIDQMDRKAMKKSGSNILFCDAWGNELDYDYDDGDNFPVITSPGPKSDTTEDDISSKKL